MSAFVLPDSGHNPDIPACPRSAITGSYSIISSARPRSAVGTVIPNSLAVCKLITSFVLVDKRRSQRP